MRRTTKFLSIILIVSILISCFPGSIFAAAVKIVSIKDLSTTVYINQSYTLPATVDATMSNKTTQKVAVAWTPNTVATSKVGTFVYKGTVKGYAKQVLLTLKVTQAPDSEILRAISYGFVPDKLLGDWDRTITYGDYCLMLKNMLSRYDSKLVPKWEKVAALALKSNDLIHRDHGMLATYYAAVLMGLGTTTNGDWHYDNRYGVEMWQGVDPNYAKWFPDFQSPATFYDIEYKKRLATWKIVDASRYWCVGQTSCVSGNTIYDVDLAKKTYYPMADLTRRDAIHAVLRTYESTFKQTDKLVGSDKKSADIVAKAEARKNAIINNETAITKGDTLVQGKTYTGTAYYVANSGSDSNNGTSPETPWATVDKVNNANLQYGDAVFFKRGDTWYAQVWGKPGVTYSAYGTGTKPTLSGSVPENAAAPDKWKLYYTGKKGEKIWVYDRALLDCSGIFFNGGASWANKVMPHWNGKRYVSDENKPYDAITGLTQDLDFFSEVDMTHIDPFVKINESGVTGPLYLRCDAGNPGVVYNKIDFALDGIGISPAGNNGKGMTVDNLKIVYYGAMGVGCAGYQGWTGTLVQNCEIGWCGGGITNYIYAIGNDFAYACTSGGAIQMSGSLNSAIGNYIHHCASKTLIDVIHDGRTSSYDFHDDIIRGNVMQYNAAALHLANYIEVENLSSTAGSFKNIIFEDNDVMYTGYGWVDVKTQRTDFVQEKLPVSSIEFGGEFKNKNEGIFITNNRFYLSKYVLVNSFMPKENFPCFSGNLYAQSENGWLAVLNGRLFSITENGEKYVRNELMDKTCTVLTVK